MLRYANYKGNVEHIMGEAFVAPYLSEGPTKTIRWVATETVFNAETNKTRVEFYGTAIG